ncbi:MAG TPA: chloride channel protein [Rhizomicrobium sp.]|nr:chloride channel protein [Rhizomicrobium sp.]
MKAQLDGDGAISGLASRSGFRAYRQRAQWAFAVVQRTLRASEFGQIVLCAAVGAFVGAVVDILHESVMFIHSLTYLVPRDAFLSAAEGVSRNRVLLVPAAGGILAGLLALAARRWRAPEVVDPIEANALYGGRMSLSGSLRLTFATLISNGAGMSLGMEAGFTQLGGAIYSYVAQALRLRRADARVMVTAGAAAAIAAAFNAPLAGAFYGFELILGSYAPRALAPVAVASVCAVLVQRSIGHAQTLFRVQGELPLSPESYALVAGMGVVAAGVGVLTMLAVTWTERGLRAARAPDWLRPVVGGLVLSIVALSFPEVLGSGHGAIQLHFDRTWPWLAVSALLVAKIVASAVSVGSGFRGGLFSSSLFIGALMGSAFSEAIANFAPTLVAGKSVYMLAGMASVGAAIIGAPLTMVFLVLEATQDFPLTVAVLVAVIIASTISRLSFGYSFATWRFHLRGLGIRGAHDVGWIADMTVGRLMRSDPKVVMEQMSVRALRDLYPADSAKRLYVVSPAGKYLGVIDLAKAHSRDIDDALDGLVAADLAQERDLFLLPGDNVRTAFLRFEEAQSEALPVLASRSDPRLVGYLTEAYALKRYAQELEKTRLSELGV